MSPNATHLLIAATLLAAPVSLGVASQTDSLSTSSLWAAGDEESQEAEEIETFSGEVSEDITTGKLDLRIDHGTIQVIGWEEDEYQIEVLESTSDSSLDQGDTEITFDETTDGDTISISLEVDHQSTTNLEVSAAGERAGDSAERAIVAKVPQRLAYEKVFACEGESVATSEALGVVSEYNASCVETSNPSVVHGTINLDGDHDEGLNVSWSLENLDGDEATLHLHNGHVDLNQLDFTRLAVETDNGGIEGEEVAAETLVLETDNGGIDLGADAEVAEVETDNGGVVLEGEIEALEAHSDNGGIHVDSPILSEGSVETDNGAIELNLQPTRSGELDLQTDNGAIEVWLGHAGDVGYAAQASSDNGDIQIALADEESSDDEAEAEDEHDYSHGEEEAARTSGYEELPIQMELTAESDNGGIQIVEETASMDTDSEDEETSSGLLGLTR